MEGRSCEKRSARDGGGKKQGKDGSRGRGGEDWEGGQGQLKGGWMGINTTVVRISTGI